MTGLDLLIKNAKPKVGKVSVTLRMSRELESFVSELASYTDVTRNKMIITLMEAGRAELNKEVP